MTSFKTPAECRRSLILKYFGNIYHSVRIVRNIQCLWVNVFLQKVNSFSDCNWTRTQNHLVRSRTLNHLAKLAKWLICVLSTYLYGAFNCMFGQIKENCTWVNSRKKQFIQLRKQNCNICECIIREDECLTIFHPSKSFHSSTGVFHMFC